MRSLVIVRRSNPQVSLGLQQLKKQSRSEFTLKQAPKLLFSKVLKASSFELIEHLFAYTARTSDPRPLMSLLKDSVLSRACSHGQQRKKKAITHWSYSQEGRKIPQERYQRRWQLIFEIAPVVNKPRRKVLVRIVLAKSEGKLIDVQAERIKLACRTFFSLRDHLLPCLYLLRNSKLSANS